MSDLDQIRFLEHGRDDGLTLLGRLAGAMLAESLGDPPAAPRIHLGMNTLPDPPYPIAAHVPLALPGDAWQRCGQDLLAFLSAGMRVADRSAGSAAPASSPATGTSIRLMRPDSIVLAWKAVVIGAAGCTGSLILVPELMDGGMPDLRHLDPAILRPGLAAWAVDRAGLAVFAWARSDIANSPVTVGNEALDPDDEVFRRLAAILAEQYAAVRESC